MDLDGAEFTFEASRAIRSWVIRGADDRIAYTTSHSPRDPVVIVDMAATSEHMDSAPVSEEVSKRVTLLTDIAIGATKRKFCVLIHWNGPGSPLLGAAMEGVLDAVDSLRNAGLRPIVAVDPVRLSNPIRRAVFNANLATAGFDGEPLVCICVGVTSIDSWDPREPWSIGLTPGLLERLWTFEAVSVIRRTTVPSIDPGLPQLDLSEAYQMAALDSFLEHLT